MAENILIFSSVHVALCGEKALKTEQVEHQVVPVPPYVNEGCGIGIKVGLNILTEALAVLAREEIKVEQVVNITGESR